MIWPTEGFIAMSNDYKETRNSPDTLTLSMFVEGKNNLHLPMEYLVFEPLLTLL